MNFSIKDFFIFCAMNIIKCSEAMTEVENFNNNDDICHYSKVRYSITDNFQKLVLELFNIFLSNICACVARNSLLFKIEDHFYDQLNFCHYLTHINMDN